MKMVHFAVIHLNSLDRVMDIFKINGPQMLEYCDANEGHVYIAAPKVNVCVDGFNIDVNLFILAYGVAQGLNINIVLTKFS